MILFMRINKASPSILRQFKHKTKDARVIKKNIKNIKNYLKLSLNNNYTLITQYIGILSSQLYLIK